METVLVFPNSLFEKNELLGEHALVYLIEHPVYFTNYEFHRLKLVFHRSTMKYYEDYIRKKYRCRVKYIEFSTPLSKIFQKHKTGVIKTYDPVDHLVEEELERLAKKYKVNLEIYDTPLFMNTVEELETYKKKKKYSHHNFYVAQRKKHNVLIVGKSSPRGGKWSFDVKNREPFPKKFKNNYKPRVITNSYIVEAKKYVNKHFKNNPGDTDLYLPIDHENAKKHFRLFLKTRFNCFGPYQDAVDKEIPFGCHSVISALINVGLLTPEYVIREAEKFGISKRVPIESLEGFIRQLYWREYCQLIYVLEKPQLEKNHFSHRRALSDVWFTGEGTTGFDLIDDLIEKTMKYSYLHHIERLMYIGNYMLLNKIKPEEVFTWFISICSIDAYNWVMYPNVYGMSQHSSGPIMMGRPYFSSSSYIDRMSSYKKRKDEYSKIKLGDEEYEWFEVWDALYYNFISDNKKEFSKNYATAAQVRHWDNKSKSEQKKLQNIAKKYMDKY